jgi:uncharacterized membrane protein YhhN
MIDAWILLAVAAAAAIVDWVAVWRGDVRGRRVERVAKPLVLLALIGAAVVAPVDGASWAAAVRPYLVAALIASLAGDILLLPGGPFTAGLAAFLLAHVAYIGAFLQLPVEAPGVLAGLVVAAVLAAVAGRRIVAAASRARLGLPVTLYLLVISAMAVLATGSVMPLAIAGAWLFVASDTMLGWGRFVLPQTTDGRGARPLALAVIVTYHVGQAALVVALAG